MFYKSLLSTWIKYKTGIFIVKAVAQERRAAAPKETRTVLSGPLQRAAAGRDFIEGITGEKNYVSG